MLIWILAAALFVIFGLIGYFQGAIRTLISFAGLLVGVASIRPLAPLVRSWIHQQNPLLDWILPPVIAVAAVMLLVTIIGYVVHWQIRRYFKFRTDDVYQLWWDRLNKRVGISSGLLIAAALLVLIGIGVYVVGYWTVQVSADESDPFALRILNQARYAMSETGLAKVVAPFNPEPPRFYQAADVVGLIYQNPLLYNRISDYPPLLTLVERPEFQSIASDPGLMGKLQSKSSIAELLKDDKILAIAHNDDIMGALRDLDLEDFLQYLQTGKSPKYADDKILGRWELDPDSMITEIRKLKPNITATELIAVKKMAARMAGVTLTATVDHRIILKMGPASAPPQAQAPAQTAEEKAQNETADYNQRRYGYRPNQPQQRPKPAPSPAPQPQTPNLNIKFSGEGKWTHLYENKYALTLKGPQGTATVSAFADDEILRLTAGNQSLVYFRSD